MIPLVLTFPGFRLDEANARLMADSGEVIDLPPKAFAVLCELGRRYGNLVTKEQLLDTVWGHRYVSDSVLKTTISQIRMALGDDAKHPRFIETVSRKGYRLIEHGPVRAGLTSDAPGDTIPPQREPGHADVELIGRRDLLLQLDRSWAAARDGSRQICWIAGEAGVGKTTLVEAFVRQLDPARVASGQCVEQFGAGEPYLPILDALGRQCEADPALRDLLRRFAPTWLMQLPWLVADSERAILRTELLGANQDRMLRELGELLDRYTRDAPFALVTEDIHWCDQATLQAMNHVARRRSPSRFLWIATFRLNDIASEEHPLRSLRREFRLHRLCTELIVDPFSEREIADYCAHRVPAVQLSEAAVEAIHATTEGLPLFLSNVVDDLISRGFERIASDRGEVERWIAEAAVPETLIGLIDGQVERLAPDDRGLLEAASVCGVEFSHLIVAEILGVDATAVLRSCDEIARQGRWLTPGVVERMPDGRLETRYAFRHALYRRVFHERLSAASSARLHRAIGGALAGRGQAVSAAEVALHFERGHEPVMALKHYVAAIQHALGNLAPSDAMQLADRALALVDRQDAAEVPSEDRLVLHALRGVASAQAFGVSAFRTKEAFQEAEAQLSGDPTHPMRGLILQGLGLVLFARGEYAEAEIAATRSFSDAKRYDDTVLLVAACDLFGQMNTIQGRPDRGLEYLEIGLQAADALNEEMLGTSYVVDPLVTMKAVCSLPLLHVGRVAEARECVAQARSRADALRQPMARMVAAWFGALFEVRRQNIDEVGALAAVLRRIADESGIAQAEGPARWYAGMAQAHAGDPTAGYALIRSGFEHNVALGMYAGGSEVLGYGAEALVLARDPVAAQRELDEAFALALRLQERAYLPQLWVVQARIQALRDDPAARRTALQRALEIARAENAKWMELVVLTEIISGTGTGEAQAGALKAALGRVDPDDSPAYRAAVDALRSRR